MGIEWTNAGVKRERSERARVGGNLKNTSDLAREESQNGCRLIRCDLSQLKKLLGDELES